MFGFFYVPAFSLGESVADKGLSPTGTQILYHF